jgi:protein disulfide-isomerase A1
LGLSYAEVEVLTEDKFDDFIAQNDLVLVEFYAPWCGHCKKLEPEYDKASKELEGTGAILAKVDATIEKKLGERFEVQGFPTIKLFRSGKPSPYESGRTAKDIVGYMKKQLGPAVKALDSTEALEAFIPDEATADPVVVGFAADDSKTAEFLKSFAKQNRDDFSFGLVTDAAAAGDNKMDTIVLFKPFDEKQNVFDADLDDAALLTFLTANSMRSVDEIGPGNYQKYVKRGLPICWLFTDPSSKETEALLENYRKVAPAFKADVSMVYLSGVQYKQMASKMGLDGSKMPGLSIENSGGEHFVHPQDQDLTAESMEKFLKGFVSGELQPTVKSEPLPAKLFDEHNVATIVGDNFKEVVLDEKKDVLIEFYAPWCGHCKTLAPKWNKLGEALKGVDSIVIAKTDATANDYPAGFSVSGFPTIKFVTSGDNKIQEYNGERDVEAFISFLKKNAKIPFEVPDPNAKPAEADKDEL